MDLTPNPCPSLVQFDTRTCPKPGTQTSFERVDVFGPSDPHRAFERQTGLVPFEQSQTADSGLYGAEAFVHRFEVSLGANSKTCFVSAA